MPAVQLYGGGRKGFADTRGTLVFDIERILLCKRPKAFGLENVEGLMSHGEGGGIERFAIHKLGENIELYTKAIDENEIKLVMDFSDYNPEDANLFNQNTSYKLLEDVKNVWYVNDRPEILNYNSGTVIRFYNLREHWNSADYKNL